MLLYFRSCIPALNDTGHHLRIPKIQLFNRLYSKIISQQIFKNSNLYQNIHNANSIHLISKIHKHFDLNSFKNIHKKNVLLILHIKIHPHWIYNHKTTQSLLISLYHVFKSFIIFYLDVPRVSRKSEKSNHFRFNRILLDD